MSFEERFKRLRKVSEKSFDALNKISSDLEKLTADIKIFSEDVKISKKCLAEMIEEEKAIEQEIESGALPKEKYQRTLNETYNFIRWIVLELEKYEGKLDALRQGAQIPTPPKVPTKAIVSKLPPLKAKPPVEAPTPSITQPTLKSISRPSPHKISPPSVFKKLHFDKKEISKIPRPIIGKQAYTHSFLSYEKIRQPKKLDVAPQKPESFTPKVTAPKAEKKKKMSLLGQLLEEL